MTFSGLLLETAPRQVMTPRATSERLVAEACSRVRGAARVADVGTGSGAIAIAIAAACPQALVWATDIDERAVALAEGNVRRYSLEGRVFVRKGDLLDPVLAPLDLIVANLPYLPSKTAGRHPELREEPFAAVFAGGDGLGPYRRLVASAEQSLAPHGALLFQLDGRAVVAERDELTALRDVLGNGRASLLRRAA